MSRRHRLPAASLILLLSLSACGGSENGGESAVQQDTAVRQVERQPLTDAELMGLARENLAMELPWTSNRVNRDPDVSPRATLQGVESSSQDTFDRVVFSLDDMTGISGYDVSIVPAGAELPCGGGPQATTLAGERMLVVRLNPARAREEDGTRNVRVNTAALNHSRLLEGGLVCDDAGVSIWAAGLAEGSEIRVLEFRAPTRLVVDVR